VSVPSDSRCALWGICTIRQILVKIVLYNI
jgi:hypothetical protein